MIFRISFLLIATALLWLIFAWSNALALFEDSFLPDAIHMSAVISTAILATLAVAGLVLEVGLRRGLNIEPNGAQRVVIYAVATFIASAIAMKVLGSDLTGILTTSALITAIVGFALQPTLGGLFSGIALQLDRHLKPGSGIIYEGEDTRIESMNWRSIIGRRRDHTLVVIPNAKLSAETIQIYPDDRATRRDTYIYAPVSIPPQRVAKLVRELVSDLTYVESTHAVMVSPVEQLPDIAALKYRVRYRIAYYFEIPEVEGEVYRRIWYGFQRHDIPLPVSRLYGSELRDRQTGALAFPEGFDFKDAVRRALERGSGAAVADDARVETLAGRLETEGRVLLYGPSERIVIPTAWAARHYLLAAGELTDEDPNFSERRRFGAYPEDNARRLFVHKLADSARLKKLADLLAQHIGPYAEIAVNDAALDSQSFADLCQRLSHEIACPDARQRFLNEADPQSANLTAPGLIFTASRDVAGHYVSVPHFRAVDEAVIIAMPEDLAGAFQQHSGSVE